MQATRRAEAVRLLYQIEAELAELEDAEKLLRRAGGTRAYIGFSGGIMIEVSKDEALEYIEERKARLRALLEKLRREASP